MQPPNPTDAQEELMAGCLGADQISVTPPSLLELVRTKVGR
jgi:hypothetical protein